MCLLRRLSVTLVMILLHATAFGQDPYYTTINKSTGLPSNAVYDIFQDSKGFVWIASDEGLTRYDGYEFKTYTSSSQTSRPGNQVEEDMYGRIWYRNFDGYLYYVENDSLKCLGQAWLIGNSSYAIIKDRIFTLNGKGIDLLDLHTKKLVKQIPLDLTTLGAELHYKDNFYLSTNEYLYRFSASGEMEKILGMPVGIMAGAENGVVLARKGVAGSISERAFYKIKAGKVIKKIATPGIGYVHGISYCDNTHWLFTPNGVWAYDENDSNINNGQPFFSAKSISSVMKDRDGNYWFGTLDEGILFVPDMNTKLVNAEGLLPNVFTNLDGTLYVGTKNGFVYSYDIKNNLFEKRYGGNVRHEVRCMVADAANRKFLFATQDFVITDSRFKVLEATPNAIKDMVVVDKKYCAIAASGITGLHKLAGDVVSVWDSMYNATLVDGKCDFIGGSRGKTIEYSAALEAIYSGSNKGLYKITPHAITEIRREGKSIYARKLVAYGSKVYFITPQNKLGMLDQSDRIVTVVPGDENEAVFKIKRAGNSLYLLTASGIRMLDTVTGNFNLLNIKPGIRSEEVNDLEAVDGKLVIASDRGVIVMDRHNMDFDNAPPRFNINLVTVNGLKANPERLANLSHNENDVNIAYSILSFSTGNRFELQYRVNGGNWQQAANTTRNLKLASLSPGEYELSFRLKADSGRMYPQQSLLFSISRPFWTQWWFWCYCFMTLSVCAYVYYMRQTTQLKKKNALILEKMELEKNLRSSMLTSIRAQMNPHFFYNALNTIQSFIFSDEKRNASTYLVKLSKLTRMILEMSEKETISLDEETEALKLYLELEKMRFSNDFNYEIRIGKDVDVEMMKIPSMIVQPYVENAIKHGLLHKKGTKSLLIEFAKVNGTLCVTIDDNGIGREKAGELNQVKKEQHQSFSTEANSKRIELLNKERSKSIGVVFIDKAGENAEPAGTTVIISIPLI